MSFEHSDRENKKPRLRGTKNNLKHKKTARFQLAAITQYAPFKTQKNCLLQNKKAVLNIQ